MIPWQWLLSQPIYPSTFLENLPPYQIWLLAGLLGLGINLLVPEPTLGALAIAAIITAIVSLTVANVGIQFLIWAIVAVTLALMMRGFVPSRTAPGLEEPSEAEVCIAIPQGGLGEVSYEGSFWSARCQISDVRIDAGQMVHVVGREGNTLIVMPIPSRSGQSSLRDRTPF